MRNAESAVFQAAEGGAAVPGTPAHSAAARVLDGFDRISKWAAYFACVCLGLLVLVLCVDIVARGFSRESPFSTWEYAGYLQAALVLMGAGYALKTGGQIRVNLLIARLGKTGVRVLDIVCSLIGLAVMAVICWALFDVFWSSLQSGRRSYFVSATPLWIPQVVLVVGSALLALQFAARVIRGVLDLPLEHEEEGIEGFGTE